MILSALPMAVGAYVMQAELGCGDLYIGSSILMITMVLSAFTLTLFIFIFHLLGWYVPAGEAVEVAETSYNLLRCFAVNRYGYIIG